MMSLFKVLQDKFRVDKIIFSWWFDSDFIQVANASFFGFAGSKEFYNYFVFNNICNS